jgi:hypothetical protein
MLGATVAGSMLFLAAPALAGAACPSLETAKVFAGEGDEGNYALVAGGTFQNGAPGWSLTGAGVVAGEGPGGTNALVLKPYAQAASPSFCVSSEYPTFRFLERQLGPSSFFSSLSVRLRWYDAMHVRREVEVASLSNDGQWGPSPTLELASRLPLWMPNSTLRVQLVFKTSAVAWAIDDVYIDPYRR